MIAIHHRAGSFSDKWIEYCETNHIDYKIVNCFDSDIIEQLKACKGLMWHWPHWDYKAAQFARQLTYSLEKIGTKVFPDANTSWHYDDKVGQKYLLEAVEAPLVPTHLFYDKQKAIEWLDGVSLPKVFKTSGGAGSNNVKLIKSKNEGRRLITQAFKQGIRGYNKYSTFKESLWKFKRDKSIKSVGRIVKYLLKLILPNNFQPDHKIEKNYIYFQDFIPENDHDIRVIVIGNRAFAIKRMVREDDFRASGSGRIIYEKNEIPEATIKKTFELNKKLKTQSIAVDWVFNKNTDEFQLVEISYAFSQKAYWSCPGYWDTDLNWYKGKFYPEYFMVEDFINHLKESDQ